MTATTRSRTKCGTGDAPPSKPPPPPPKPLKRNTKAGLVQAAKDPIFARESGANLLESLREEQNQELNDALGGGESGRERIRGRGRGRGRGGRGRGRGSGQSDAEMTSAVEDLEVDDALGGVESGRERIRGRGRGRGRGGRGRGRGRGSGQSDAEMTSAVEDLEVDDALGGVESGRERIRGRGRGRGGRGRGRGRVSGQSDAEMSSAVEDLEVVDILETDGPDGDPSVTIQDTLDEMQLDAVELEAEMSGISNDGFDMDTNHADNHIQPDIVSTGIDDGSDQEYESWDGFGSVTQINKTRETKQIGGGPKGLMKFKTNTKSRVRKTSVGMVGKRKATPVPETPRKRIASQRQPTTEPLDMDEATSRPGGFADDEDGRSIKADRKEVIGQKKISRRTATATVSITHNATSKPKVVEARKIGNIPPPYKEKFDTDFVPSVVKWVAQSEEPWNNPDGKVPLQKIHDKVYRTIDGIVDRHHPLIEPLKSKLTAWRVAIRKRAQKVVDEHLSQERNIFPASSIREYIGWLKPASEKEDSQDAPFMFSTGLEYKAVPLQGKYLNPLLLETFAAHFGSSGVNDDPTDYVDPPPIGAFALSISAVERALESWKHGKPGQAREFSRGNWGLSTDEYIDGLNKISETRWKKILSETQQFTPYKPREVTATPEYTENYRTKAPESDVEI